MKRTNLKIMLRLIGLTKPLTAYMVIAILMGLFGHLCASFITILGSIAVVKILKLTIPLSFASLFTLLILFAVLRGLLRYAEQYCNHFVAFKLLALIRNRVFIALRKLCPAKLEGKDKGNLISVITSDIELLEVFYAHTISPTAIAILFTIVISIFLSFYNPIYSVLIIISHFVIGVFVPLIISNISGSGGQNLRNKSGDISSFILDSLRGISEIIQYDNGIKRLTSLKGLTSDISKDEERLKKVSGINVAITNLLILIFVVAMIFTSIYLYSKGKVDFAGVVISVITLISSFGPAIALANLGSTLQSTFAAGNRVLDILDEEPIAQEVVGENEVCFENASADCISFSYKDEEILSALSLDIEKDKIVGITGKSGSGKSTLLKLFMRFWLVEKGKVSISNVDVNYINSNNLRSMESFVTQETHLFKDSLKNNIKIAKLNATDEQVFDACKKASIHDFIVSLPKGYDTDVGELGDTLSGGEKQRIGLARAFLHDAPFILLDEPTSNLDSINEAVILKALKEKARQKTILLVSHRQSTMCIADKSYSVENGRMS